MLTEKMLSTAQACLPREIALRPSGDPHRLGVFLPNGDVREIRLPKNWEITVWEAGFGGWCLRSGETTHFARVQATVRDKYTIRQQIDDLRLDLHSEDGRETVAMLIGDGIELLGLEEQMGRQMARIVEKYYRSMQGRSQDSILRAGALFRRGVNQYLTEFPAMFNPDQELPFYQSQVAVDYEGYRSGATEAVRDHIVAWLTRSTLESPVTGDSYRFDPTATSKGEPGKYVSTFKPTCKRLGEEGEPVRWALDAPVILAACQPIVGNRKRAPREMGGMKKALPLANPRPLRRLFNGFEAYQTEPIAAALTEACVLFATCEGFNFYSDSIGRSEGIHVDDVGITPEGRQALTALINERAIYSADEWRFRSDDYLGEDDKALPGVSVRFNYVPETSIKGQPLCSAEVRVVDRHRVETWQTGKVLIDLTHKAMVKGLTHSLVGVERDGTEHVIELVVCPASVRDKKIHSMLLSAVLARLEYGYVPDPERAISPDRKAGDAPDAHDDLVREAASILKLRGESPDGRISVFRQEDGRREYLGEAVVGYLRTARLMENERTASRARRTGAVPVQRPLRHLLRMPAKLDPGTEHLVNLLAQTTRTLNGLGGE